MHNVNIIMRNAGHKGSAEHIVDSAGMQQSIMLGAGGLSFRCIGRYTVLHVLVVGESSCLYTCH